MTGFHLELKGRGRWDLVGPRRDLAIWGRRGELWNGGERELWGRRNGAQETNLHAQQGEHLCWCARHQMILFCYTLDVAGYGARVADATRVLMG